MQVIEERPWGTFEVLSESETFKVKKIVVNPGHRLSLQYHFKRSEIWTVVQGDGIMTVDGTYYRIMEGSVVRIPKTAVHRVENDTKQPLVIIEVQRGKYLGEDDIVRLEDDYERK
jgi:mannose-6-phosphate isomerase-like protein (cupin superfamily)